MFSLKYKQDEPKRKSFHLSGWSHISNEHLPVIKNQSFEKAHKPYEQPIAIRTSRKITITNETRNDTYSFEEDHFNPIKQSNFGGSQVNELKQLMQYLLQDEILYTKYDSHKKHISNGKTSSALGTPNLSTIQKDRGDIQQSQKAYLNFIGPQVIERKKKVIKISHLLNNEQQQLEQFQRLPSISIINQNDNEYDFASQVKQKMKMISQREKILKKKLKK